MSASAKRSGAPVRRKRTSSGGTATVLEEAVSRFLEVEGWAGRKPVEEMRPVFFFGLVGWLVDGLVGWKMGWLVDGLVGWLMGWKREGGRE